VLDGNNLFGARADGWWRDRAGAARRLAEEVDAWQRAHGEPTALVFDGHPPTEFPVVDRDGLTVRWAESSARDAADDVIVALVEDLYAETADVTVATSDRGLRERLPPGVTLEGAGTFTHRLPRK
jgi:predicted RNA-binding protein with PIN domain